MNKTLRILGISAHYHDSAVSIVEFSQVNQPEILAAIHEERLTRKKNDNSFPFHAIEQALTVSGLDPIDIDYVVYYEKPLLKFMRIMESLLSTAPKSFLIFADFVDEWFPRKLFLNLSITRDLRRISKKWPKSRRFRSGILRFSEHHLSHAASAAYPSGFSSADIVTIDGVGEFVTTSFSTFAGDVIERKYSFDFPHSLGLFYATLTAYLGFKVNEDEYKVMGLAPYGNPVYKSLIEENLISYDRSIGLTLNTDYFSFERSKVMYSAKLEDLLGFGPRKKKDPINQHHMNLARSLQDVLESILVKMIKDFRETTSNTNLCLAGGVALNCVANSRIFAESGYENVWIQPASGDAGGSLGAPFAFAAMQEGKYIVSSPGKDLMKGSFLGAQFDEQSAIKACRAVDLKYRILDVDDLRGEIAEHLSSGKIVGWHQGRAEFGPRALGNRSILADPRNPDMQSILNLKTKFRESFRPFAPAVLEEYAADYFMPESLHSPYMLFVNKVKNARTPTFEDFSSNPISRLRKIQSPIPAVTHVDLTARVQVVKRDLNPNFHALIHKFYEITKIPVLINTSFNVNGEPIVDSPEDAIKCFKMTEIDILVMGNVMVIK